MYATRTLRKKGGYKKTIFCVYSYYVPKEMSQKGHREIMKETKRWRGYGKVLGGRG